MSKIHTTVRVGVDGSLTLPAFFMRGMGYEPGEEVPITTPANQYICDCDANRLLVTRTCDDAECTGYTSSGNSASAPRGASVLLIRRLTPLECERLQGFPDGWTDIEGASDSARYKALGNSVAIPCVDYVLQGIAWATTAQIA